MGFFAAYVYSVASVIALGRSMARGNIGAAPAMIVALSLFVACLSGQGIVYSDYAKIWSHMGAYYFAGYNISLYAAILSLYWISFLTTPAGGSQREVGEYFSAKRDTLLLVASMLMAISAIAHISVINLSAIINNNTYLFMASSAALAVVNPATILLQASSSLLGLLSFALFGLALSSRARLPSFILLAPCTWYLAFQLGGHSRYAFVYCGITAIILIFGKKKRLGIMFLLLAAAALINALAGRGTGPQGLAHIGDIFKYLDEFQYATGVAALLNIFEGVYVQGESFRFLNTANYPELYKILSFSPLPSAIDGFRTRALPLQIRLNTYVPMGATGEVILFGTFYVALYWSFVFWAYRRVLATMRSRRFLLFTFLFCIFLLCTLLQFAYPVRWVFRFYVFILLLSYLGPVYEGLIASSKRRREHQFQQYSD